MERERKKEGGRLTFEREWDHFNILKVSTHILEVSVAGPRDLACLKRPPANISTWTSSRVSQLPTNLQRASLLHPCMRDPKWDADPECQPNY
jgi:hypothetical protein